ncbi:MAG: 23S rRNA (guanosine(2251)-2'-O)-methyltransferase RlmB [Chromatiaceae bacterium]|nr:23S rRNA (guanosine(2251)-2'-O)-methyltransferase RlmB [Chromatiaceae bacterium]
MTRSPVPPKGSQGLTPVAGIHSVRGALKHGGAGVDEVWLERRRRDRRLAELAELARGAGVRLRQVEAEEIEDAAPGINHQGALAWVSVPVSRGEPDLDALLDDLVGPPFLLILDEIQDPHNLGACLRTADAAGIQAVIAPRDNAVGLTPTVSKVASGAAENVPYVQVTNLARTLDALKARGIWLVGLAGEAEADLYGLELKGPIALVLGGEGRGLRRLTRERCDYLARLPMLGTVESLNVSVATGICLYEALRQRRGG